MEHENNDARWPTRLVLGIAVLEAIIILVSVLGREWRSAGIFTFFLGLSLIAIWVARRRRSTRW